MPIFWNKMPNLLDQTNNPEVESQLHARDAWTISNQELLEVLYRLTWRQPECCITGSFPLTHYLRRMPLEEATFHGSDTCRVKRLAHNDDIDVFYSCYIDPDFVPDAINYPLKYLIPQYDAFLRGCKEKGIEVFCQHQTLREQHRSCDHGRGYHHFCNIRFIFNLRLFKKGQLLPGKIQLIFLETPGDPICQQLNWGQYVTSNFDIDIVGNVAQIIPSKHGFVVLTSIPPTIKIQIHRGLFRYNFKHYPSFLIAYSRILKYQRRGFRLVKGGGLLFEPHQSPAYIAYIMRRLNCALSPQILNQTETDTRITRPLHNTIPLFFSTPITRYCRSFHRMIVLGDMLKYVKDTECDLWGNTVGDLQSFKETATRSRHYFAIRIIEDAWDRRRPIFLQSRRKSRRSNKS